MGPSIYMLQSNKVEFTLLSVCRFQQQNEVSLVRHFSLFVIVKLPVTWRTGISRKVHICYHNEPL